ncbi:MAG: hypothetical protein ACJASQ_003342 [Crocinitomicaceae bacterium]|jgi:hypothetical protein
MRDKKFSNIVSERFDGFGDTPSDAVWENITGNLDGRKKRLAILWWTCSLAAVLALSFLAFDSFTGDYSKNQTADASKPSSSKAQIESQNKKRNDKQIKKKDNTNYASVDSLNDEQTLNSDQASNENPVQKPNLKPATIDGSTAEKPRLDLLPKVDKQKLPMDGMIHPLQLSQQAEKDGSLAELQKANEEDSISSLDYAPLDRIPIKTGENDIISLIQILPVPKWRIGAKATGFVNSRATNTNDGTSATTQWTGTIAAAEFDITSHRRFFEAEVFVQRLMKKRFYLSTGILFSMGQDLQYSGDTLHYQSDRITFGIPIAIKYSIINGTRFRLTGNASLINEFARVRTRSESFTVANSSPGPTSNLLALSNSNNFQGYNYAFGVQASLEASYSFGNRFRIHGEIGYRNYLIEQYSTNHNYVVNPNYFNSSIGVSWRLQ